MIFSKNGSEGPFWASAARTWHSVSGMSAVAESSVVAGKLNRKDVKMGRVKSRKIRPYSKYAANCALGNRLRDALTQKKWKERAKLALEQAKFRYRDQSENQWARQLKVLHWMRQFAKADKKLLEKRTTEGVSHPEGHDGLSMDERPLDPESEETITIHRDDIPIIFFLGTEQQLTGRENEAKRLKKLAEKRKGKSMSQEAADDLTSSSDSSESGESSESSDSGESEESGSSSDTEESESESAREARSSQPTSRSNGNEDGDGPAGPSIKTEPYKPTTESVPDDPLKDAIENYNARIQVEKQIREVEEIEAAKSIVVMSGTNFIETENPEIPETASVLRDGDVLSEDQISLLSTMSDAIVIETDQDLLPGVTYEVVVEAPSSSNEIETKENIEHENESTKTE